MSINNELSAQHISANLGQYEAARSGFFSFIVDFQNDDKVPRANSGFDNPDDTMTGSALKNTIRLNVVQADVPHFQLETLRFRRGNDEVKFAGVPTFNGGSIVVDDVIGMDSKSALMAWQALAYDVKSRKGGRMRDYKKNCTLVEYTQDFEKVREWVLYGCWVSNITEQSFNKESDSKRQITANIEYDRAEMISYPGHSNVDYDDDNTSKRL